MSLLPDRAALQACLARVRPPTDEETDRLLAYCALLDRWNRSQRLVGWKRPADLLERGLLDAWTAHPLLADAPPLPVVDLGSGAGLPGVIYAIGSPERSVTLVESRRKRASFLREVLRAVDLPNLAVHHGRAEDLLSERSRDGQPPACLLTSRAFTAPADFVALGSSWNAAGCLVSTSRPRLPAVWPPAGWVIERSCRGSASPDAIHQLLLRA